MTVVSPTQVLSNPQGKLVGTSRQKIGFAKGTARPVSYTHLDRNFYNSRQNKLKLRCDILLMHRKAVY